jgi:Putative transposase of IS4/5 family (DUF4096)
MRRRHELTDAQWNEIKDLLSGKEGDPGRTAADNRLFVDVVLYVLKTGIPWEDLPARSEKSTRSGSGLIRGMPHESGNKSLVPWENRIWRKCNWTPRVSKPTRWTRPAAARRVKKRNRGPATLPGTQPRRTDNQTACGRGPTGTSAETAGDRRTMWRCSAGGGPAGGTEARNGEACARGRGL